ncbi:MAG: DUF1501 domain-containing protein [Verrucomicrobiota bacterium]|nr:DUF1501 domain-containing protein [Verrucomicrobiota bacterium]
MFPSTSHLLNDPPHPLSRREMLRRVSCGFGMLALAGLCREAAAADSPGPLAPKLPHFAARAKRVIFLFMVGGPSQHDTFDYKPRLNADDGQTDRSKQRQLLGSPWKFSQHGRSGLWISELCPHVARHADELCVLKGLHTDKADHTEATLQLHTGSSQFVRPSVGAWTLYGLGTENQNLPGFITISPRLGNGGAQSYGSAFLPAINQGTRIGDSKRPVAQFKIKNLANPRLSSAAQREQLDLIQSLNRERLEREQGNTQLEGVIQSYELAFRMQTELPQVMDFSGETQATLEMYGIGEGQPTDNFGRQCLMARRFVESGVRFVEVCHEFWDHHGDLSKGLTKECLATDQPIGALLADLKERGLLEDTLVVWGGEFGRTPDSPTRDGRDHNPKGYTMWLAGGGVKGGLAHGATDEHGYEAVDGRVHLHDLHATMLHLLGLDHERLTYQYGGRDFRLTDVHGRVVKEILA